MFMDIIADTNGTKPDFYALQEHRICCADLLIRREAAACFRGLKLKLGPALKMGDHAHATSGGTATGCKAHIGRKAWPPFDSFVQSEAARLGLPVDWALARLSVSIVDGPYSGGMLWFSIYLVDGVGLSGNN